MAIISRIANKFIQDKYQNNKFVRYVFDNKIVSVDLNEQNDIKLLESLYDIMLAEDLYDRFINTVESLYVNFVRDVGVISIFSLKNNISHKKLIVEGAVFYVMYQLVFYILGSIYYKYPDKFPELEFPDNPEQDLYFLIENWDRISS